MSLERRIYEAKYILGLQFVIHFSDSCCLWYPAKCVFQYHSGNLFRCAFYRVDFTPVHGVAYISGNKKDRKILFFYRDAGNYFVTFYVLCGAVYF